MWTVSWRGQHVTLHVLPELETYLLQHLTTSGTLILNNVVYIITVGDITQHPMTYPELYMLVLGVALDTVAPQSVVDHAVDMSAISGFVRDAQREQMWLLRSVTGLEVYQSLGEAVAWLLGTVN